MTKNIWNKIYEGSTLSPQDLTPEEKKRLYALFERYDMPISTCYKRFFDKGFSEWEIVGVSHIKEAFLLTELCDADTDSGGDEGSRGYGYVRTLDPKYDDSKFYELVTSMKMGKVLCEKIADMGMASQMTVRTRFKANDWKSWENRGVRTIIEEFMLDELKTKDKQ